MHVAIVGSRGFDEPQVIVRSIDRLLTQYPDLVIVSGGAKGADLMAEAMALELNIPILVHDADWDRYGRSAGFKRNELIVRDADIVLAFYAPGPRSKGTSHTVDIARAAGKPVHIYHEGRWS